MKTEMDELCERFGVTMEPSENGHVKLNMGSKTVTVGWEPCHESYRVADVLAHALSGESLIYDMTEKEFVRDAGVPRAEAQHIYRATKAEVSQLRAFLGEDFDTFCGAQH